MSSSTTNTVAVARDLGAEFDWSGALTEFI
jgi:hypothetical protein